LTYLYHSFGFFLLAFVGYYKYLSISILSLYTPCNVACQLLHAIYYLLHSLIHSAFFVHHGILAKPLVFATQKCNNTVVVYLKPPQMRIKKEAASELNASLMSSFTTTRSASVKISSAVLKQDPSS